MASFVITNCGKIAFQIAKVDLEPGSCRGCPMEHLDQLTLPEGSEFFITHNPDTDETGKQLWSPDIMINDERLEVGKRTDIIKVEKELIIAVDTVKVED